MSQSLDSSALKVAIIFLILIAAGYFAVKKGYVSIPWDTPSKQSPIYDTDPKNDKYIKGDMTLSQMMILDRVLNEEKKRGKQRLSGNRVSEIARGDQGVIDAYGRWRKCHDLMRSSKHVVYPNERGR